MSDETWDVDDFDLGNDAPTLTSEQRERRRDQLQRRGFEAERDRREAYLHMDQRIRNIAGEEISKVVAVLSAAILIYGIGHQYGPLAGIVAFAAALIAWWYHKRGTERRPSYKIDEVDNLAEDTVTHSRIVELAEAGEEWLTVQGSYLHFDLMFAPPFWQNVNGKVREYTRMTHADREKDNKAAHERSLPYRRTMEAKLRAVDPEWTLPSWAWLNFEERKL